MDSKQYNASTETACFRDAGSEHLQGLPRTVLKNNILENDSIKWSPPLEYQLPSIDEYVIFGRIYRQKGRWRKRWVLENFSIQNNVLFFSSKIQRDLIKLCIPLHTIKDVKVVGGLVELQYLRPIGEKRFFAEVVQLKGYKENTEDWVATFQRYWNKAHKSTDFPGDFVDREQAQKTIECLYSKFKAVSLIQFVRRLVDYVECQYQDRLRSGFWVLVSQCNDQATRLKRFYGFKFFSAALRKLFNSYQGRFLRTWKLYSEYRALYEVRETAKNSLVHIVIENNEALGQKNFLIHANRMHNILQLLQRRSLTTAFARFFSCCSLTHQFHTLRQFLLRDLLTSRILQERQVLKRLLILWKHDAHLSLVRFHALKTVVEDQCKRRLSAMVCRWHGYSKTFLKLKFCAVQHFVSIAHHHTKTSLHAALFLWFQHVLHERHLKSLKLTAQISRANNRLLVHCNRFYKEKACYGLISIINGLYFKQTSSFFYRIRSQLTNPKYFGVLQITFILLNLKKKKLFQSFAFWKPEKLSLKANKPLNLFISALQRAGLRQLTVSFGILLTYSYTRSIFSGLVRVRKLQKLAACVERRYLAVITQYFTKWRVLAFLVLRNTTPPVLVAERQNQKLLSRSRLIPLSQGGLPKSVNTLPADSSLCPSSFSSSSCSSHLPQPSPLEVLKNSNNSHETFRYFCPTMASAPTQHCSFSNTYVSNDLPSVETAISYTPFRPKYRELVLLSPDRYVKTLLTSSKNSISSEKKNWYSTSRVNFSLSKTMTPSHAKWSKQR